MQHKWTERKGTKKLVKLKIKKRLTYKKKLFKQNKNIDKTKEKKGKKNSLNKKGQKGLNKWERKGNIKQKNRKKSESWLNKKR